MAITGPMSKVKVGNTPVSNSSSLTGPMSGNPQYAPKPKTTSSPTKAPVKVSKAPTIGKPIQAAKAGFLDQARNTAADLLQGSTNITQIRKSPVIGETLKYVKGTAEDVKNVFAAPFQDIPATIRLRLDPKGRKELDKIEKSKISQQEKIKKINKLAQKYGAQSEEQMASAQRGAELGGGFTHAAGNVDLPISPVLKGLTGATKKVISKILGREVKPEEVLNTVINSTIEKTPEGKKLIKTALQAEKEGKTILIEAPKVKQLESPKPKEKYQGEGFTMAEKADEGKIAVSKATNEYKTKLDKYNQNPTPENLKLVQNAKAKLTEVKTQPQIVEKLKPVKVVAETKVPTTKIEVKLPVEPIAEPITPKTSGVAKQIEAKAVEKGMIDRGYNELAQYDSSTIKAQSEAASKYSIEDMNKIATGEVPLPKELKPGTPLSIAEDYAIKNGDSELIRKLANSPLATQISESASELSLSRMRDTNSPVKILRDVKKMKDEVFEGKYAGKKVEDLKKKVVSDIKRRVKVPDRVAWSNFVDSIEC